MFRSVLFPPQEDEDEQPASKGVPNSDIFPVRVAQFWVPSKRGHVVFRADYVFGVPCVGSRSMVWPETTQRPKTHAVVELVWAQPAKVKGMSPLDLSTVGASRVRPILCSHIPNVAIVSHTTRVPQCKFVSACALLAAANMTGSSVNCSDTN